MSDWIKVDDLTMTGADGIRRSFDEHFDSTIDVEQDPLGAHHAIQNQHARIEELEANINMKADFIEATLNDCAGHYQEIEELKADNARLREAMKDIATPAPHGMTPDMRIEVLRDVARAALKETDK